ncbi:hypothetical protein INT48_000602 [Thamnidium elegans]|uniref:Uncharacterized protein n=1 Tax=Thamnidium elegans TaxID=101142 RepID=A0A8H7SIB7_9FUNG|nr:hypothetical protein INT48_000602 [Thamnidium elegans]
MARETGGPVPHKGCNSSSCCSPAKLWRTIQTLIKDNNRKGLVDFFKDSRIEHIVRVALTSRISNDSSMLPPSQRHKLVKMPTNATDWSRYLGKSLSDLNSLQLALISSSEPMVLTLLAQLRQHATPLELKHFVNHVYGQGNSSLHLAVFLKRYQVVKVLLELGCKPDHVNARNKNALDCCYYGDQDMMDLLSSHNKKSETVKTMMIPMTTSVPIVIVADPTDAVVVDPIVEKVVTTESQLMNSLVDMKQLNLLSIKLNLTLYRNSSPN